MTNKNSHSDQEELWSRSFDDEDFTEVPYSRSAKKKAEKHISPVTKTILIFGILLLILPTGAYFWWLNEEENMPDSDANNQNDTQVLVTQNDSTSSSDSSEVDEEVDSTKEEPEEEPAAEETDSVEEKPEEKPEPVEEPVEEKPEPSTEQPKVEEKPKSEPVTTPEPSGNTYTVKAGDNLYRIALNHNMTTEELRALNGINGDEISVGMVLKVK